MKTLGFIVNSIAGMGENKISKREAFRTVDIWQCEKPIAKIKGKLKVSRRGAILYVSVHARRLLRRDMFCYRITGRGIFLQGYDDILTEYERLREVVFY